jgi:glycosyltransferase involved in cell wall biosynthesis
MKVSLITVTYNAEEFIDQCIQSVLSQTYNDIEYIIVDGGSTDSTMTIIEKYKASITKIISEPDKGIYDAMNKGIALATGDIIGILNSDDFFPENNIIETVADAFGGGIAQIVYGNLWYILPTFPNKIIRKWKSQPYKKNLFQWGWMPAHTTFFAKRDLFAKYGNYNIGFKTAADYELMLRFIHKFELEAVHINKVLVIMRTGGVSNRSLRNRLSASWNDFRAMRHNSLKWPLLAIMLKPLRKISQYF